MTEAPKDTDADLYRASAVMIREGGTHPGFLCLSATHLAFRSAAEGGSAGQELWQAALDTVDETILDVGSQLLVLAIGGEEFSFLGEELEGLHLRMRDLLDADESLRLDPEFAQTAPITRPDYEEQPERVLLDGTLQRFVNNYPRDAAPHDPHLPV